MKDARGVTIYIGKAISLKKRVSSYFRSNKRIQLHIKNMLDKTRDLETLLTDSETEALILENNLIKSYQPRYNIRLKDAKSYPFIKITLQERYPRLIITRNALSDGSVYFGPYTDVKGMRRTLYYLRKFFPLAICTSKVFQRSRPCIEYQIKKCVAPCTGQISKGKYNKLVVVARRILEGKHHSLTRDLHKKIKSAARNKDFEKAAEYRDQLRVIEKIFEKQKIIAVGGKDQDIIAIAHSGDAACAQVFLIREGTLLDQKQFILEGVQGSDDSEIYSAFVKQYYSNTTNLPKEIVLQTIPTDVETIQYWLSNNGGIDMKMASDKRETDLIKMAFRNATLFLNQNNKSMISGPVQTRAVKELQQILGLADPPNLIEGFDISNIQGIYAVGSMVTFENAKPKKTKYRRFRIKTVKSADDYLMMREIVKRRYSRLLSEGSSFPNLVLIDGGKGHLRIVCEALNNIGVNTLPIIALAKGQEEIFISNKKSPIILPKNSQALLLVQQIRDEAHRFAIQYHQILRGRNISYSVLDQILGLGIGKKRSLLQHFGSVEVIKHAREKELTQVRGIGPILAKNIKYFFKGNGKK